MLRNSGGQYQEQVVSDDEVESLGEVYAKQCVEASPAPFTSVVVAFDAKSKKSHKNIFLLF